MDNKDIERVDTVSGMVYSVLRTSNGELYYFNLELHIQNIHTYSHVKNKSFKIFTK